MGLANILRTTPGLGFTLGFPPSHGGFVLGMRGVGEFVFFGRDHADCGVQPVLVVPVVTQLRCAEFDAIVDRAVEQALQIVGKLLRLLGKRWGHLREGRTKRASLPPY